MHHLRTAPASPIWCFSLAVSRNCTIGQTPMISDVGLIFSDLRSATDVGRSIHYSGKSRGSRETFVSDHFPFRGSCGRSILAYAFSFALMAGERPNSEY